MRRLLICLAVCVPLLLGTAPAPDDDAAGDVAPAPRAQATYEYGGQPRQKLTAHWKRGSSGGHRTGVVILHGGYWSGNKDPGWDKWAARLPGRGLAAFNVEYRRNVDAHWPGQREDVLKALRWIKKRARTFGVDPDRLVLVGSSAGGHLAADAGTYGHGRRHVAGVVGLSAVADPLRAWREGARKKGDSKAAEHARRVRANARLLAGCTPRTGRPHSPCSRRWQDMRALRHASGRDDAPMLLIHSERDFVPATHAHDLERAERRKGAPARQITVRTEPGGAHGGPLLWRDSVTRAVLRWSEARG